MLDTGCGMTHGSIGDHEPSACPILPRHSPQWPRRPLRLPAGENPAGASSPTGLVRHRCGTGIPIAGLAILVFEREIKLLRSTSASPGGVLLVCGEVLSAGRRAGFSERNGEQTSAGGRLSSHAAAGHPRRPGFPFSACLVAVRGMSRVPSQLPYWGEEVPVRFA